MAFSGQGLSDAFSVGFARFFALEVTRVNGVLQHTEAEFDKRFAELGVASAGFGGIYGQIEEGKEPHAFVLREFATLVFHGI